MARNLLRLSDMFGLRVAYEDETPFGGLLSTRIDEAVRGRCAFVAELRRLRGLAHVCERGPELLERAMGLGALGALYEGPGRLRDEVLYPPPSATRPRALVAHGPGEVRAASFDLPGPFASELAGWLGDWQRGAAAPRGGTAARLWATLAEAGALVEGPAEPRSPHEVLFAGHATVRLGGVLVDPFLRPHSRRYPPRYQPPTASELAPDAIAITHAHPDHFDPGSLLRFGRDTPIYVPAVARESILAVDMAARLRELGFTRVGELAWFGEARAGAARLVALPFHGEQPTADEVFHPEARNQGNLYLVEASGRRYALTADAGADASGDTRKVATLARARYGALDVLFGGHRQWAFYPVQYFFCSVSRYALFVPPSLWPARQVIMNDADALLDVAERWGAGRVVPYANGGAPWFWDLGLGPRLDGVGAGPSHFDPPPEQVRDAARARSEGPEGPVASPVRVSLMRPGEALAFEGGGPGEVVEAGGRRWPYAPGGEARASA